MLGCFNAGWLYTTWRTALTIVLDAQLVEAALGPLFTQPRRLKGKQIPGLPPEKAAVSRLRGSDAGAKMQPWRKCPPHHHPGTCQGYGADRSCKINTRFCCRGDIHALQGTNTSSNLKGGNARPTLSALNMYSLVIFFSRHKREDIVDIFKMFISYPGRHLHGRVRSGMQLGSMIHRTAGTVSGKARQQMGL